MENKNDIWRPVSEYTGGRVLATNGLDVLIGKINSEGDCESEEDGNALLCGITGFIKIEEMLPDLKESEDERIRKQLIAVVELYYGETDEQEKKDCLSWLEKKGEHVPAWSEEDEMMLECVLDKIGELGTGEMCKDWLKFIKERVQPQPKQEWSDRDKTIIESIEALCDEKIESVVFQDVKEHANDIKDWLTDLKERYAWKPSDEQIKSLQESIGIVGELTPRGECLKELVEQLKKL